MLRMLRYQLPLLTTLGLLVGCGGDAPKLGKVTGRVTLEKKPVENATVNFTPMDAPNSRPSTGVTDSDGRYELKYSRNDAGALIGKHRVTISTAGSTDDDKPIPETIPAIYNVNTNLTRDVVAGSQEIDFDLEPGPVVQPDEGSKSNSRQRDPDTCGEY